MKRIYIAAGLLSLLALMPWLLGQSSYGSWRNWAIYTASSDTVGIDANSDGTAECTFGVTGTSTIGGTLDCGPNDDEASSLKMYEDETNGTNTVTIKAPLVVSSDRVCRLRNSSNSMFNSCIESSPSINLGEKGTDITTDTSDDRYWFRSPTPISVFALSCIIRSGTSIDVDIQECAADGTGCTDMDDPVTCTTTGAATFITGTADLGDWVAVKLTNNVGNAQELALTLSYVGAP